VVGASQSPITINIPPTVFNLSESYLMYSVNIPATVGAATPYIWYALQALREVSHIQYYTGSNNYISDIDNLQNYLDITLKKELSQDEFLSLSAFTGVSQNNSVINVTPALRNANINGINTPGLASNPSSVNYVEPGYFQVGANATSVSYVVQFPLRLIKNSIFSIDKNLYFGQPSYLKLYFGPSTKLCYMSSSNNSPSDGIKASYIPTAGNTIQIGTASGNVQATQLQLMLAVETNQDLRTMTINKVTSSGLSYMIPYVQAYKNSNVGTSQNISIQLDSGNGKALLKVYHAPYNINEDLDTMYDHSNNDTVSGVFNGPGGTPNINQKLFTYYTQLNGKRNQDITIDCTVNGPFTDYMSHRRQLRGSILSNLNVYQYNWFHCDDWSGFQNKYDQDGNSELISGLPMTIAPLTWSFVGLTLRAATGGGANLNNSFQWYTWFVFVKKLTMTPTTVILE